MSGLADWKMLVEIGNGQVFVVPINVGRVAELRLRRQRRLGEDGFQGLVAVMATGAIRTLVGGRDVMRDQLRHLIEVTQEYPVARTSNLYPSLDDTQYDAVVNGRYLQSPFSNASGDSCPSPWPTAWSASKTTTNQPHHILMIASTFTCDHE